MLAWEGKCIQATTGRSYWQRIRPHLQIVEPCSWTNGISRRAGHWHGYLLCRSHLCLARGFHLIHGCGFGEIRFTESEQEYVHPLFLLPFISNYVIISKSKLSFLDKSALPSLYAGGRTSHRTNLGPVIFQRCICNASFCDTSGSE